jgi:uncharacterized protein (DUF1015 family)
MADISPFSALHFDPRSVGALENVVTQPYDKITPKMQDRYYGLSQHNLARIIRRQVEPRDTDDDPYAAAAADFRRWIEGGILVRDDAPALYPYDQEYSVPGQSSVRKRRRGFIALCRLEDYSARVVHRHEETLSGPKADRLALLRATRAHFGQIFLLYSDPDGAVERDLAAETGATAPWQRVEDEYGTRHEVWRLTAAPAIERIRGLMRDKKLVIADGHHRYETALAYREEQRAGARPDPAAEFVMATFVRMEADGLLILPTHRVVHGLQGFDWERFLASAREWFAVEEWSGTAASRDPARLQDQLAQAGRRGPAFVACARPDRAALLVLRSEVDTRSASGDAPPELAGVDVFVLHRLLIEGMFGISRQAVRDESNLHYERDAEAAMRAVDEGKADVCFLVNSTPIEAVRDNAFAGQVMPQKSTDFYPKLLSGLTIYDLDSSLKM